MSEFILLLSQFMGRSENLKLAKWAFEKTRQLVPFSTNTEEKFTSTQQHILLALSRRKIPRKIKQQIIDLCLSPRNCRWRDDNQLVKIYNLNDKKHIMRLGELYSLIEQIYPEKKLDGFHQDGSTRFFLHDIENSARNSVARSVGNCGEMSAIVYCLLLEYHAADISDHSIRVEFIDLAEPADHSFVVIGRAEDSTITDTETWGPDAVICDPWGDEYFCVIDQWNLPPEKRSSMFYFIDKPLFKYGKSFSISDFVGAGHSDRWHDKDREDISNSSGYTYSRKNRPIFFKGASIKEELAVEILEWRKGRSA